MDRKFWKTGWPGKAWWGGGGFGGDFESRLKGGGAARHEAEKTFRAKGTAGGGVCLVAVPGSPPQSHL